MSLIYSRVTSKRYLYRLFGDRMSNSCVVEDNSSTEETREETLQAVALVKKHVLEVYELLNPGLTP